MAEQRKVYSNAQPLECCDFPHLQRRVGVTVSDLTLHHASLGEAVEVHFERVTLNTSCAGEWKSVSDAPAEAERMNQLVIEDLDRVIAELQAHRERLAHSRIADQVSAALKLRKENTQA